MLTTSACSKKETDNCVLVKGGTFRNIQSEYYDKNITIVGFLYWKI